jgi:uncharacterized protein (DUF2141 family)
MRSNGAKPTKIGRKRGTNRVILQHRQRIAMPGRLASCAQAHVLPSKWMMRSIRSLLLFPALLLALGGSVPALAAGSAVRQPATACAGPPSDTWLDITIDKVRSDQGVIAVTVYPDDPHKFLIDGGSLYVARVPARADKTRMCLFLPHTGVYALAVYHDEDNSGTWNRVGPMGLPAEGFGFSGNPGSIESLLAFHSVRLSVPKTGLSTHIRLRYP